MERSKAMRKEDMMRNAKINVINITSSKDYRLLKGEEWKRSCCLDCCAKEVLSVRLKIFMFPWGEMSVKDLRHAVDSALTEIFWARFGACFSHLCPA
ncbi:hypothetical protein SUGI_1148600 [Cryptomeria japonica]|nr:hypothetical protein SUGI_1148600 [Cryptomeria japonica]